MLETVFSEIVGLVTGSSAPNLHALVIHFPIALLVVALLLDLACLAARRHPWLVQGNPGGF